MEFGLDASGCQGLVSIWYDRNNLLQPRILFGNHSDTENRWLEFQPPFPLA